MCAQPVQSMPSFAASMRNRKGCGSIRVLQRSVLLLLQDGRYLRAGSCKGRQARVRSVCTSGVGPAAAMRRKAFRRALFLRVEAIGPRLSVLRERNEDIPQLWDFFWDQLARRFSRSALPLTPAVLRVLEPCGRPGSLCEKENRVARVVIFGDDGGIGYKLRRRADQMRFAARRAGANWGLRDSPAEIAAEGKFHEESQGGASVR